MKASVIIPAYNARRWLPETLASVAAQDHEDMEVIIVDDGSTDDTAAYVAEAWPQYTLIRTENCGVSHARNLGSAAATGGFIQFLDADDLLLPGKLARQVRLLEAQPEADIVYCNWQRLAEQADGSFAPAEKIERTIEEVNPDPQLAFFSTMWSPTGCYLYRREFLPRAGEWKAWLPVVQDARFAWDCARAGAKWVHDPQTGVLYRQHRSGSVSTRSRLAFERDCLANIDDMSRLWQEDGQLTGERLEAVLSAYHKVTRTLFEIDRPAFAEVRRKLLALSPGFRPPERSLRLLAGVVGYENAEHLAGWYRRAKGMWGAASGGTR